jgi:hypothetical protein
MTSKTTNKFSPEVRARTVRMVSGRVVRARNPASIGLFVGPHSADAASLCCDGVATAACMRAYDPRRRLHFVAFRVILDSAERARRERRHPKASTPRELPPLTN